MSKFKNRFENLIKHLVEVEEEGERMIDELFLTSSKEREELQDLLKKYVREVENLLQNRRQIEFTENFPLVTVGCTVRVQNVKTGEFSEYRVVLPFSDINSVNDVSCFSPVGKSLLLKRVNDEVGISVPAGYFLFKIISISYDDD